MSTTTILRRLAGAVAVAAAALGLAAAPALAHTQVASTSPKPGRTASKAPRSVTVTFTGQIRRGTLTVTRAGKRVSRGSGGVDPRSVKRLRVALRSGLRSGTYTARWSIVAADGHHQHGSFRFKVRRR